MEILEKIGFRKDHDNKGQNLVPRSKDGRKYYPVIKNVYGLGLAERIEMTKSDGFPPDNWLRIPYPGRDERRSPK